MDFTSSTSPLSKKPLHFNNHVLCQGTSWTFQPIWIFCQVMDALHARLWRHWERIFLDQQIFSHLLISNVGSSYNTLMYTQWEYNLLCWKNANIIFIKLRLSRQLENKQVNSFSFKLLYVIFTSSPFLQGRNPPRKPLYLLPVIFTSVSYHSFS